MNQKAILILERYDILLRNLGLYRSFSKSQNNAAARTYSCPKFNTGVGVTKPISPVPLFSQFFIIVKTHFNG